MLLLEAGGFRTVLYERYQVSHMGQTHGRANLQYVYVCIYIYMYEGLRSMPRRCISSTVIMVCPHAVYYRTIPLMLKSNISCDFRFWAYHAGSMRVTGLQSS